MTMLQPIWAQDGRYPAQYDRLVLTTLATTGVVERSHCRVRQRAMGANMSVDIYAGIVAVSDPNGGMYLCISDSLENRAVAPAPAAGTSRIDKVVARVRDSYAEGTGTGLTWDFEVLTGIPASTSPSSPAIPPFAYVLAELHISAGAISVVNANITDWRDMTIPRATSPCMRSVTTVATAQGLPTTFFGLGGVVLPVHGPHIVEAAWTPVLGLTQGVGIALTLQCYAQSSVTGGPIDQWTPETSVGSTATAWPAASAVATFAALGDGALQVNAYARAPTGGSQAEVRAARLYATAYPCMEQDVYDAWAQNT